MRVKASAKSINANIRVRFGSLFGTSSTFAVKLAKRVDVILLINGTGA